MNQTLKEIRLVYLYNRLLEELRFLDSIACEIIIVPHLAFDLGLKTFPHNQTPLLGDGILRSVGGGEGFLPEESFTFLNSFVLSHSTFGPYLMMERAKRWLRAGPRKHLYFDSEKVKVAIITTGGLCPGTNVIIRELIMSLNYNYKVKQIIGVKFGFGGLYDHNLIELTPAFAKSIHHQGGSILGGGRKGCDITRVIESLKKEGINQVYIIGGNGSMKAVESLYKKIRDEKLLISVCAIPRSLANDVPIIDKSFGFDTGIEVADNFIRSAYFEAKSHENCISIVKLLGEKAGFFALESVMASRDADICLIPEIEFELYGPKGLLESISQKLVNKKFCVIVVAEGVKLSPNDKENLYNKVGETCNSEDILLTLKSALTSYIQDEKKVSDLKIKTFDPTYMIQTVLANPADNNYCSQLSQNAIHSMMAGYTGVAIGAVNNKTCLIPLSEINSGLYPTTVRPNDRAWQRLLASTGQGSFINEVAEE